MSRRNRVRSWATIDASVGAAESILVIGLGRFGTAVAQSLSEMNVEVMALDTDQALVDEWAHRIDHVRQVDATNAAALRQIGAEGFDAAVVAIGGDLEASILTVATLADLGLASIWAKAITAQHANILHRVGANEVIFPEKEMGERVAHMVTGEVSGYVRLDVGFVLAELGVPGFLQGRRLGDTDLRKHFAVTVVCVKPLGGAFTYATADTVLSAGDTLVVAGANEDAERFVERAARDRSISD